MFRRLFIAARGEIALRIQRACREMGIETVAGHSEADTGSLPVQLATEAICVGPAAAKDSYLNQNALLSAALATGCEAIHPGYGFLSENPEFADACRAAGLAFVGPSGDAMRRMGNKTAAKKLMQQAGVPVVPGSDGPVDTAEAALAAAAKIGYPVLLKASAGGGGRGMRIANTQEELPALFAAAKAEAQSVFGNGEMYIEKRILRPRHIEIQILADRKGNCIHLGERECSIQRRHQKLIEESPSKALSPALRQAMGAAAVRAALAAGYENAGTIEFILDADGNYYFIEMNTRIQVEHPVTEMVTGVDLVQQQIRIAAGLPLDLKQSDIQQNGWAIECRINAEDPSKDFAPAPGAVGFLHLPAGAGVRVDSALYTGYQVPPYYDSLVAKVIVHAPTRLAAIRRMRRALEEMIVDGFPTTRAFCHLVLYHPGFLNGQYDTAYLEQNMPTFLYWLGGECGA